MRPIKDIKIPSEFEVIPTKRRVLCALGDYLILLVVDAILFLATVLPTLSNMNYYKDLTSDFDEKRESYQSLVYDSKIRQLNGENEVEDETIISNTLSYYLNDEILDNNQNYNDPVLYFYVTYSKDKLTKNNSSISLTLEEFNQTIYKIDLEKNTFWDISSINDVPRIKNEEKAKIQAYLNGNKTGENQTSYKTFADLFSSKLNEARTLLSETDQYVEKINNLSDVTFRFYQVFGVASIILYSVTYFLYFYFIPLLLKNGQTLTKKAMKICLYGEDKKPITNKTLLLRSLLGYLLYFPMTIFIPYLVINIGAIFAPIFYIGGSPISLMYIAFPLMIVQICSIATSKTKYGLQLHDTATRTLAIKAYPIIVEETQKDFLNETTENEGNNVF